MNCIKNLNFKYKQIQEKNFKNEKKIFLVKKIKI